MKKIAMILLLLFSSSVFATSKAEAEKWYDEFRVAKDKVFDGLFISKTTEHIKLTGQLNELTSRAEKLFGKPMTSDLANCTSSALAVQIIWENISDLARTGQLKTNLPAYIATKAWNGGEKYPTCLNEIDKLK